MSVALGKNVEVIRRMEDGQTCPNVCRSVELLQSSVSAVMESADKIKH